MLKDFFKDHKGGIIFVLIALLILVPATYIAKEYFKPEDDEDEDGVSRFSDFKEC